MPTVGILSALDWRICTALAFFLFVNTFGIYVALLIALSLMAFLIGCTIMVVKNGCNRIDNLANEFANRADIFDSSTGIARFLTPINDRIDRSTHQSITGSEIIDANLEQIINYTMRDFIDTWYSSITNDLMLKENVRRSMRRSIAAVSVCLQRVDWVDLMTRHIVDDFASHLRLYRKAKEKMDAVPVDQRCDDDLESYFFDLELEMEKSYCRDLVSTSKQYENAYLHDITDILLYLIVPMEDFRCRPLRFLLREIVVKRIMLPLIDQFSDPDYINYIIVWLLSEVNVDSDDFIAFVNSSNSIDELEAINESVVQEIAVQRAKDTGGEGDDFVKQQLSSLRYVCEIIRRRIGRLADKSNDSSTDEDDDEQLCDLPIRVVLTQNTALSFFIDFLQLVGGQNYIDCYLAIEGFKVSVEHQLRGLETGDTIESEVRETISEAARFMYDQYLSQKAIDRVPLDDATVNRFLARLRNNEYPESWFDGVQDKIVDILTKDARFYPAFMKHELYMRMLADLDIVKHHRHPHLNGDDDEIDATAELQDSQRTIEPNDETNTDNHNGTIDSNNRTPSIRSSLMRIEISTLGIGQQGNQSFAIYNMTSYRLNANGEQQSCWNVLRRYSDFHTFHSVVEQRFMNLNTLSFPGKKTFNNLDSHFLEKRKNALQAYMMSLVQTNVLEANDGLFEVVMHFLCQKDYTGEPGAFSRKMVSAVVNPIRIGVRALGTAVTTMPDTVYGGVARVGDGINKAAKQVLGTATNTNRPSSAFAPHHQRASDSNRVGAAIDDYEHNTSPDSIPLRIILLFVDEVFGLRARNQWFRRRLVAFLRQFVHAAFGSSINRKIIDLVCWLTSAEQVAEYLRAFRHNFWPGGQLSETQDRRPDSIQLQTRMLAKAKMLAALPDELRLFIGNETSRTGIELIFDALQNPHLNRRLTYVLLERLLSTVFPNNRFGRVLPLLHSKSPRVRDDHDGGGGGG